MNHKLFTMFVLVFLVFMCQTFSALARDIPVQQNNDDIVIQDKHDISQKLPLYDNNGFEEHDVYYQCEQEETTEDAGCKEICIPKGYRFGLCVNHKCTCI